MIAIALSLGYVLFGSWDSGWSPSPLWARILFFPGVAAGHLCWTSFHLDTISRVVGIATMGLVGGIIGWVLHVLIRSRQNRQTDNETGSD
jgi:hypothetical protein